MSSRKVTDEIIQILSESYTTMSLEEIRSRYKWEISKKTLSRWTRKLGLKHNEETRLRLYMKCYDKEKMCGSEAMKKKIATHKKNVERDKLRIKYGLEPKYHYSHEYMPDKVRSAIYRLTLKYNYFRDKEVGGPYTLFYDCETKRIVKREPYYTKKYGIKFEPAEI
jgi:hypothetical protein